MQTIQKLITDNIDLWASAKNKKNITRGRTKNNTRGVYGIQKMRELILELAITGKLVSEKKIDLEENKVFEDIEAEIKKLTEEGIISKRKQLTPIIDDEKIFKIPSNWEWIKIGNTGKIFNGNSINENEKKTKYSNIKKGRPFIATKDVGYGREKLNYKNGISIPYDELKFKTARKNAVLICSEGGSAGKKIGISEFEICFGNKLLANETFSAINPRYIFYIYQSQSFYKSFSKRMNGIIGGISINEFLNITIPIPPTNQQNLIVNKIDELMLLCDQLEENYLKSEKSHAKLVKVLLDSLNEAVDDEKFKESWELISIYFNTLFTTEESIEELKKTILQLGITGKLSFQDQNDEPAEKFLNKIKSEKIKLIDKGKLKKEKKIQNINDKDKPFNLPKGWSWIRLNSITELITKGSSPRWQNVSTQMILMIFFLSQVRMWVVINCF